MVACLQIIEAMPHTQVVSGFVEKLGDFYQMVDEDQAKKEKEAKLRFDPSLDEL